MQKSDRKLDLVLLIIWPIVSSAVSLFLKGGPLWSLIVFLIIPSAFLSFKNKSFIKKSAVFSAIIGVPIVIIFDYIGHYSKSWFVGHSIFPYKIFGLVPVESALWGFFLIYYTVMFYEYFLDRHLSKKLKTPRLKYLLILILLLIFVFSSILFITPKLLNIRYFYLIWGMLMVFIPLLISLLKFPNLSKKFFLAGSYFFFFSFIYELTALKLGWWKFIGDDFIGWVSIFKLSFPFEELFFWFLLLAMATLSYYEFFDDDEK